MLKTQLVTRMGTPVNTLFPQGIRKERRDMKTTSHSYDFFSPQTPNTSHHASQPDEQPGSKNSWSDYDSVRPKNVHHRVNSDLFYACFSLVVLLLFAAADAVLRL